MEIYSKAFFYEGGIFILLRRGSASWRIFLVGMCFFIFIYFSIPRKADAIFGIDDILEMGAGLEAGVLLYTAGAMVVAGGAVVVGNTDFADKTFDHARNFFKTSQAAIGNSIVDAYNTAVKTGSKLMHLSSDVTSAISSYVYQGIAGNLPSVMPASSGTVTSGGTTQPVAPAMPDGWLLSLVNSNAPDYVTYNLSLPTGYEFLNADRYVANSLQIGIRSSGYAAPYNTVGFYGYDLFDGSYQAPFINMPKTISVSATTSDVWSYVYPYVYDNFNVVSDGDLTKIKDAYKAKTFTVSDVIPRPNLNDFIAYPMVGDGSLDKTKKLTWDQTSKVYKDATGAVYTPDSIGWDVPKAKVVTNADGTTSTAIPVGTDLVDITTGAVVGSTDTAAPAIPDTLIGKIENFFDLSKPIDFNPLKAIPQTLTTAFPFSLPWDIGRMLDTLTATGVRPDFDVSMKVNGKTVTQQLPFGDWVDPLVPYIRSGVVLLFTLGLVFAVRKLFGGAT